MVLVKTPYNPIIVAIKAQVANMHGQLNHNANTGKTSLKGNGRSKNHTKGKRKGLVGSPPSHPLGYDNDEGANGLKPHDTP